MNAPHFRRAANLRSLPLILLIASACARGSFAGEVTQPDTAAPEPATAAPGGATEAKAPAARHERVVFNWTSTGDEPAHGRIQTSLPDGEAFSGKYHEITRTVAVTEYGDIYSAWSADPWTGDRWYWGGAWPDYGNVEEFVTSNTGKVVATLEGDRGTRMRCRFTLDEPDRGMKGGGTGECQLSSGERITTRFEPQ